MKRRLTIGLAASIGAVAVASAEATAAEEPKLILAITIDGLRGVRGSARRPAQRPGVQPVNSEPPIM